MTVSYQYEVASSTSGGFTRLLFMWKGSLYKLIYRELFLFLTAFGILSALYRNAFTEEQKRIFEKIVVYCDNYISMIPLSFVLGFYVAYVAGRWWQQYMAIPWPDKLMHLIALYIPGNDEHGRMLRRTMMRYLNLTLILVLRSISSAVKRRFPTLEHLVEAGFITTIELEMYQSVPSVEFNTYWIPCTWFISLLKETRKTNRITDSQGLKIIMEEFNEFRSKCGMLWSYDWVSLPLVYTQVVTIATYSFFLAALVGRQYVEEKSRSYQMEVDIYIPVFTILQFFFYMGLLKVAEQLINPFGDDDEDFELNWLIDRHTKVSYLGVDILMARAPPLVKDKYFDDVDLTLPYTEASVAYKKKTYRGSVHDMQVPEEKHTMFLPEITEEDEEKLPTPRGSVQNLQAAAIGATATAAAAAAGIWRSQLPSSQNLFKFSENVETECISIRYLEEGLAQPTDVKVSEVSCSYAPPREHSLRAPKPLSRSESAPGRKPSLTLTQWPSSSTLCKSDSFRMSEISIDVDGGPQEPDTPMPQYSSFSPAQPKHHSFSGGEFLSLKPDTSSVSNLMEPRLSPGRRRALVGKIKSLPKLLPVKRHSSMGSAGSSSRSRKGVRWKPMTESPDTRYLDNSGLELERLYHSSKERYPNHNRYNSLETSDIKFAGFEFPSMKSRLSEDAVYCELCRRRVQRISVSPNPEIMETELNLKHSASAPIMRTEEVEVCVRNRSHSWQNKILDKIKFGTKRKESSPSSELQCKQELTDSTTFTSQSVPNLAFWVGNSLLSKELDKNVPSVTASKESLGGKVLPPLNSSSADVPPVKTLLVPNPEQERHASCPPTSRKNSDILTEGSQEASSWKSADWTTLLSGDVRRS
ncbi:bestrophin-3-like isoform X2 [Periplaneta americana]|uniref:bestrophin-3-like isoform X2 n=1 Tax=Periplaneta americana TaxID=6978 RepID=UPI0037E7F4D1